MTATATRKRKPRASRTPSESRKQEVRVKRARRRAVASVRTAKACTSTGLVQAGWYVMPELLVKIKRMAVDRDVLIQAVGLSPQSGGVDPDELRERAPGLMSVIDESTGLAKVVSGASGVVNQILYDYFAQRERDEERVRARAAARERRKEAGDAD